MLALLGRERGLLRRVRRVAHHEAQRLAARLHGRHAGRAAGEPARTQRGAPLGVVVAPGCARAREPRLRPHPWHMSWGCCEQTWRFRSQLASVAVHRLAKSYRQYAAWHGTPGTPCNLLLLSGKVSCELHLAVLSLGQLGARALH